jgi:hypothetical protein
MQAAEGQGGEVGHAFEVAYEPGMARQAAALYWRKAHLIDAVVALGLIAFALFLLTMTDFDRNLPVAALVVAGLLLLFQAVVFLVQWRRSLYIMRRMKVQRIRWRFTDDECAYDNQWGRAAFKWPLIRGILMGKDLWLLQLQDRSYMTFPVSDVPPAARDFLRRKIEAQGSRVR